MLKDAYSFLHNCWECNDSKIQYYGLDKKQQK